MELLNHQFEMLAWVWQPMFSRLHIYSGTAVLVALTVFAYARTFRGRASYNIALFLMRLGMIASIAVLLMGPSTIPDQQRKTVRPKLRIVLDTSESMLTDDCDGMSRMEFVQKRILDRARLQSLSRDFTLEISGFDEELHTLDRNRLQKEADQLATGRATRLSDCISSTLARIPTGEENAFLVVISDGRDSQSESVQPAAALARSRKVPVYTVCMGDQTQQSDLAVLAVPMQDFLLPGEPGAILVKIYQVGLDNAATTLTVSQGDDRQQIPISFNNKRVIELQVPVRQENPGQYEYIVTVDPIGEEVEPNNNQQIVFCDVQKRRIRILILEGQPFWDSKFLAQSLRKDERIELTQITQLTTQKRETLVTRAEKTAPQIPGTAEEWAQYDIVILGQALENILSEEAAGQLDDFVSRHGGHLIFARGMAYDPDTVDGQRIGKQLAKLEPVVWGSGNLENVSLSLTPTGRTSQWFSFSKMGLDTDQALARLAGFQNTPIIEREKAATIVLAQASATAPANANSTGQPAIVRMTYARGTVVGILGDGLWQWSLLPPDAQDLASFYDTFWSNLVRWLAMGGDFRPDHQVALHLSHTSLRKGDPMLVDVVYKHTPSVGAHPKLELTNPANERREIALLRVPSREPRFRATFEPEELGVFQLRVQAPGMQPAKLEKKFNVYDINEERMMTAADPMALRILSEHSKGRFYRPAEVSEMFQHLQSYRDLALVPPKLEYIWDQGVILVLLLVWSGMEWLLRRLAGLL